MNYVEHRTGQIERATLPVFPAWAARINVEDCGSHLLVRAEGSKGYAPRLSEIENSAEDFFSAYRAFAESGRKVRSDKIPAHILFARATDAKKLRAFVEQFGPVWGELQRDSVRSHNDTTEEFIVKQELASLGEEQLVFARALVLLGSLRSQRKTHEIVNALNALASSCTNPDLLPQVFPFGNLIHIAHDYAYQHGLKHDSQDVCLAGHAAISALLNRFPPHLAAHEQGALEMPQMKYEGILPSLYFMLRSDYLYNRRIGICRYSKCNQPFRAVRLNARFCSILCSQKQRQHEYYERRGRLVRLKRRRKLRMLARKGSGNVTL